MVLLAAVRGAGQRLTTLLAAVLPTATLTNRAAGITARVTVHCRVTSIVPAIISLLFRVVTPIHLALAVVVLFNVVVAVVDVQVAGLPVVDNKILFLKLMSFTRVL